jgi:hypothetical protein
MKNETLAPILRNVIESAVQQGWKKEDIQQMMDDIFEEKSHEQLNAYVAEGSHGTCSWNINLNGVLTIFPTNGWKGTLANQSEFRGASPWRKHADIIKRVSVQHGVATNKDASGLFAGLTKCIVMDVNKLDTTRTESMSSMFSGCKNIAGVLNINNFDTRNTIDTSIMFKDCEKVSSIYMENAETGKVLNAMGMFEGCKNLVNLYADKADLKSIPNHTFIMAGCDKFKDQNLAKELGGTKQVEMPNFLKGWTPPRSKTYDQHKNIEADRC